MTHNDRTRTNGERLTLDTIELTAHDVYLFNEGSHFRLYEKMGAHKAQLDGRPGVRFAVWAPNAERVSVVGDFNGWNDNAHRLHPRGDSGIWHGFVPGVVAGALYKYRIFARHGGFGFDKADPFAFRAEVPPRTASVVHDLDYSWGDEEWMRTRAERNSLRAPMSVYEIHPGSWMRVREEGNRSLNYRELAPRLTEYVLRLGFTHVELLPIMNHPFFGSWGYQVTGYFAPSGNFGSPQDLMYLIDYMHRHGIGVILDWVPSHFPTDAHGLAFFDGTHLYEHADPRRGFHPDWNTAVFNYGRHEVRSFLTSNALFWLDRYHADGLRVDAVASMLYLDYSRKEGEWLPNVHGGRENVEAIEFLRRLNAAVYENYPDVQTIAEESTAWPMVSRPAYAGGLGFGLKWDMGWMHDTLQYFSRDPIYRKYHHGELPFRMVYAFTENFVLPLSHDEVVHGKGSLLGKMPGDDWQKFANLRLLYGYMYAQPGKKLLFMGGEFGQRSEWRHDDTLEWYVADMDGHAGVLRLVADLNRIHRELPAFHELDVDPAGFEWIDAGDHQNCVLSFVRRDSRRHTVLVLCNFTPSTLPDYRVGVPVAGAWRERLNTDASVYGGSGQGNPAELHTEPIAHHGRAQSLVVTVPPLGALYLESVAQ